MRCSLIVAFRSLLIFIHELNPLDAGLDLASHKLEDIAKISSVKNTNEYNSISVCDGLHISRLRHFFSIVGNAPYSQLCRAQPRKFFMNHSTNYDNSLTPDKSTKTKKIAIFLRNYFSRLFSCKIVNSRTLRFFIRIKCVCVCVCCVSGI